ncbi:MAG: 3-keto-disaccharide hydrolase [Steroidobacteraceae bacterium]
MRKFGARTTRRLWPLGLASALAISLAGAALAATSPPTMPPQTKQDLLKGGGGWHYFIKGNTVTGLRGWTHAGLPGWTVHDGVLSKNGPVDDLESTRTYKDFDLELEWNIGREGNSGIFYRATHEYDQIYWTGPEYQLVDDANTEDGKSRLTAAGSVYAVYPSPAGVIHPYGHWNKARIIVRGNHVEYFANGRKIVDYYFGSADWKKRVAASKFKAYPGYGRAPAGLIGLQGNHPGSVEIRNMRIRVLP